MKEWWRDAVIYQIYPRSFQDSNDDGIGDAVNQLLRQCSRRHMTDIGVFRRDAEDMLKQQPWVDAPVGLAAKA